MINMDKINVGLIEEQIYDLQDALIGIYQSMPRWDIFRETMLDQAHKLNHIHQKWDCFIAHDILIDREEDEFDELIANTKYELSWYDYIWEISEGMNCNDSLKNAIEQFEICLYDLQTSLAEIESVLRI